MQLGDDPAPGTTSDSGSTWTDVINAISSAVSQGVNVYDQIQLQNFNMDLIKQGRPPLTPSQVGAIAPQFAVGLAPQTQNMLLWLAAGAGGLILLTSLMKHKRAR
jgi:hypothetical protein